MDQVVLENKNSVQIREDHKYGRHYTAINTLCSCGDKLIVAPAIYNQAHIKSDPVIICSDFVVIPIPNKKVNNFFNKIISLQDIT